MNPLSTSYEVVEGIIKVMKHLTSHKLPCPHPIASCKGNEQIELSGAELLSEGGSYPGSDKERMKYPIYVLSFIPGQVFDHVDKKFLTPALLHEVGELLGKIDKELMV